MRTIELILGSIIVVSTLVDIFQSVVVPRPTRGSLRLAPFLLDGMWPLWTWIAFRFPSAKYRAALLGYYAPLTVVILLLVWGIALIFGYGLLFLALQSELQPRASSCGLVVSDGMNHLFSLKSTRKELNMSRLEHVGARCRCSRLIPLIAQRSWCRLLFTRTLAQPVSPILPPGA
jgi:hypothetical protein